MSSVSYLRHSGWFAPEYAKTLNIIGVGATGSFIGLIAAKMGVHKFVIWDPDLVESHNVSNQIYDSSHIGMKKVDAFEEVLTRFNPQIEVIKYDKFFTTAEDKEKLSGHLVLTVDTMSARKDIYSSFSNNYKVDCVYETRIGWDYAELNLIDPLDILSCEEWQSTLVNDDEIPDGPCNLRICTTLVSLVASYAVHCICNNMLTSPEDLDKKYMFNLNPRLKTYFI